MILSDVDIHHYLANKSISMFPPAKPQDIRPTGIRLHLGSELLVPKEGQTVDLDSSQEILFDTINISKDSYLLRPGQFILGSTLERFQVSRNLVCHLDGRSTVARIGLTLHCTSSTIDGNYEEARSIVLEMKNEGPFNIVLRQGIAVGLLSFSQLLSPIKQNTQQQYRGQSSVLAPNFIGQKR